MRTTLIICFCLILLGVATLPAGYAQSFSITDLGTPDGFTNGTGANSVTHAINAAGAVAGEWGPNTNSERAYLYAGNTNTDLGMLPGALYEAAYSVNAANVVVGMAENINGYFYAFAYTNGALVNLSVLGPAGYTYSLARAINNNSMIVGESYTSSLLNSPIHAVIFLGSQQVTDLGTLTNGTYSAAYGINNSNVIVGESTVSSGIPTPLFIPTAP